MNERSFYITLRLSDGRKITGLPTNILLFRASQNMEVLRAELCGVAKSGTVCVNIDHVIEIRRAEAGEIEHYKIHGY